MNAEHLLKFIYEEPAKCPLCGYRYTPDDLEYEDTFDDVISRGIEKMTVICRVCGFKAPVRILWREMENDPSIRQITQIQR